MVIAIDTTQRKEYDIKMNDYKTEDYTHMLNVRLRAFRTIASELGKDHMVTKLMGNLSYGRHDWETGPEVTLRKSVRAMSALDGVFQTLIRYTNAVNDMKAQNVLLDNYPRSFSKLRAL